MLSYEQVISYWLTIWKKGYATEINSDKYCALSQFLVDNFGPQLTGIKSFCELGIGSGRNIHYFHEKHPEWRYSANDINPDTRDVIFNSFPDVLEYTEITILDTLKYLESIDSVDVIFTQGHLMHIPDDVIYRICALMAKKATSYIAIHEAQDHLHSPGIMKHESIRFERSYFDKFPGFEFLFYKLRYAPRVRRLMGCYVFEKEQL